MRVDHEELADAVGPRAAGHVVEIEVGDCGGDDVPTAIEHGVMHQREGQAFHDATSSPLGRGRGVAVPPSLGARLTIAR